MSYCSSRPCRDPSATPTHGLAEPEEGTEQVPILPELQKGRTWGQRYSLQGPGGVEAVMRVPPTQALGLCILHHPRLRQALIHGLNGAGSPRGVQALGGPALQQPHHLSRRQEMQHTGPQWALRSLPDVWGAQGETLPACNIGQGQGMGRDSVGTIENQSANIHRVPVGARLGVQEEAIPEVAFAGPGGPHTTALATPAPVSQLGVRARAEGVREARG